jgi:hypothetical protein
MRDGFNDEQTISRRRERAVPIGRWGTHAGFGSGSDLSDGKDNKIDVSKVDVSMDGIELEDREFIAAIKEKREPNSSLAQVIPCMRILGRLEAIIDPQRKAHA